MMRTVFVETATINTLSYAPALHLHLCMLVCDISSARLASNEQPCLNHLSASTLRPLSRPFHLMLPPHVLLSDIHSYPVPSHLPIKRHTLSRTTHTHTHTDITHSFICRLFMAAARQGKVREREREIHTHTDRAERCDEELIL